MVKAAVVILNWNGRKLLEQFLPVLIANTPKEYEIVIGDNASTDDSCQFVQKNFPALTLLVNSENWGYAGGYNKILEQVEAEYYILLNSDVEVSKDWIDPLIRHMDQNPEIAASQPKILSYFQKDHFEYAGAAGGYMDCLGYFFCRGRLFNTMEIDSGQYDDTKMVFWASGAAFFIRSKDFHESGGFDASLFAHMEEIDLCWRLQRKGRKIAYIPHGTVYHMGGQTLALQSSKKTYLNFRNNLLILYKNLDAQCRNKTLFIRFCMDFITWIHFIGSLKWKHAWAINRAHYDFLRMRHEYPSQKRNPQLKELGPSYTSSLPGYYNKSLVWEYFIRNRRKFSELV